MRKWEIRRHRSSGIHRDEVPVRTMKDCSVVTATYELGDGMRGTIGIIGPKRMDYENVVDSLKKLKVQLDEMVNKKT